MDNGSLSFLVYGHGKDFVERWTRMKEKDFVTNSKVTFIETFEKSENLIMIEMTMVLDGCSTCAGKSWSQLVDFIPNWCEFSKVGSHRIITLMKIGQGFIEFENPWPISLIELVVEDSPHLSSSVQIHYAAFNLRGNRMQVDRPVVAGIVELQKEFDCCCCQQKSEMEEDRME
uniref:Uncharacterized protein n=1 Tax=Cannabis sativa TaxID=3483 RepID=A0A803QCN3_CANSA